MGAHETKLDGLSRRARQYYYEGLRTYKRIKLRVKSWDAERRGRLARRRGDDVAARRYLKRAMKYRRMLHDPEPALSNLLVLAAIERERGLLDDAAEHLEEARQVCQEIDPTPELLAAVVDLREGYEERGDEEAVIEWTFAEIFLARVADPDWAATRPERHRRYLELVDGPGNATEVYDLGLRNVLVGDPDLAAECLEAVWNLEEEVPEGGQLYGVILAAGIARLALAEIGEVALADDERESIRDAVAENRRRLSNAAAALFDVLAGDEPDVDPGEFDAGVEPTSIRASLRDLEGTAFARLIVELEA